MASEKRIHFRIILIWLLTLAACGVQTLVGDRYALLNYHDIDLIDEQLNLSVNPLVETAKKIINLTAMIPEKVWIIIIADPDNNAFHRFYTMALTLNFLQVDPAISSPNLATNFADVLHGSLRCSAYKNEYTCGNITVRLHEEEKFSGHKMVLTSPTGTHADLSQYPKHRNPQNLISRDPIQGEDITDQFLNVPNAYFP